MECVVQVAEVIEAHLCLRHRSQTLSDARVRAQVSQQAVTYPARRYGAYLIFDKFSYFKFINGFVQLQENWKNRCEPPNRARQVQSVSTQLFPPMSLKIYQQPLLSYPATKRERQCRQQHLVNARVIGHRRPVQQIVSLICAQRNKDTLGNSDFTWPTIAVRRYGVDMTARICGPIFNLSPNIVALCILAEPLRAFFE